MTAVLHTMTVDEVARDAVLVDEATPLGQAWYRLHEAPGGCGLVVRGRMPIAVVTAGDLAERWPGGGPLGSWSRAVGTVLDRPLGVELLAATEPVEHAARRVLASGLYALPVAAPDRRGPWRLVGLRDLLAALLDARGPA